MSSAAARPILAEPPAFTPERTLYVSPFGDDDNSGLSEQEPLQTISAAAAAVQPGDLVLVAGGTYYEHVHLTRDGTAEQPIVFRAAPDETALVIFGEQPSGWQRLDETRTGYVAEHALIPNYVMDERFLARYAPVQDLETLDEMPGSFLYDEQAQTLAVHPLRSLHPDDLGIRTIAYSQSGEAVAPGEEGYAFDKGFWIRGQHNRVEGFHITYQPIGIQLRADFAEAWGNTVYGNALTGVQIHASEGGVLANNISFLNDGSGVHVTAAQDARVIGNLSWGNTQRGPMLHRSSGGHAHNLALYGRVTNPTVDGNLVIAQANPFERGVRLLRYKGVTGKVVSRGNTLVGGTGHVVYGETAIYDSNTVVEGRLSVRGGERGVVNAETAAETGSTAANNLYLTSRNVETAGFVDPERWDYRMHAGSRHLGTGAWPDAAPVRYVSPQGDDGASGQTPHESWQTLSYAADNARPGDTIYIMPGVYQERLEITTRGEQTKPVEFLSYGRGKVILEGDGQPEAALILRDARHVTIDGLIIRNVRGPAVAVHDSETITFIDNVIDGAAAGFEVADSARVAVQNCTFVECETGIRATGVRDRLVLRNNLFMRGSGALAALDDLSAEALISERNAFAGPEAEGQLKAWASRTREGHPSVVVDVEVRGPDYLLPSLSRYSYAGLGHRPLGARGEAPDDSAIEIDGFRVVYQGPDRVTVEWTTPADYPNARITWSDAEGKGDSVTVHQDAMHQILRQTREQASLEGLTPRTAYEAKLEVWDLQGRRGEAELTFRTAAAHSEPRTYYVHAEEGDDANSGTSPSQPMRTISAAVYEAGPGSTILVGPGVYPEMVQLSHGGIDESQRLTIRSSEAGKAILDHSEIRPSVFVMNEVNHITIDGFRIRGMVYGASRAAISIANAQDIEITNCIFEKISSGGTSSQLIEAARSMDLHIHNNLFQRGFHNIKALGMDRVRVERNTFYLAGVTAIRVSGDSDAEFRFTENIFYDVSDRGTGAIDIRQPVAQLIVDRNLYYRNSDSPMRFVSFRRSADDQPMNRDDNPDTLEALRQTYGLGMNDRMADPLFLDPENGDFRLAPHSPAKGMADDGGDVGMREPPAGL